MPDFHIGLYNNSTNKLVDSKTFTAVDLATALTDSASDAEFLSLGTIGPSNTNNVRAIENSTSSSVVTALLAIQAAVYTAINDALASYNVIGGQLDDTTTTQATEDEVAPVRITSYRAIHSNLRNNSGAEIGTSTTPIVSTTAGTTKTITRASIDIATSGVNTVIAAPGGGNRIKIIAYKIQNTSDTDLTVILKSGTTAINGDGFLLGGTATTANAPMMDTFFAPGGVGQGEIVLGDNEAFVIDLSAAKQVSGYVIYRVDA
jgi:hypothetical protein